MFDTTFVDKDDCVFSHKERDCIQRTAGTAETDARTFLPQLPLRIELTVQTGSSVIPETGELGAADRPNHISWTVDPSHASSILDIVRTQLRPTLFHELNHIVRKLGMSHEQLLQRTLMDRVISEGLATAFERDAGGRQSPWGQYPNDVQTWVEELLALPTHVSNQHYIQLMSRHPDGRRWIGYRVGTYLVDCAIAKSGLTAAELVSIPTTRILEIAGVNW
ncbi:MAG: DUF2268 domain-containing putative Zn-dependent protease [Cyanobacteria bacterium J06626_18]